MDRSVFGNESFFVVVKIHKMCFTVVTYLLSKACNFYYYLCFFVVKIQKCVTHC